MSDNSLQIPKIIHYCWFGGQEFPPLVQKCMGTWDIYLKDWHIMRWDETNIPNDVPFLNYALEQKLYAFAADFMRFYALYHYGGIYLDTDMEIIKDLSPLLEYKTAFVASEAINKICPAAGVVGGNLHHVFFKMAMREYTSSKYHIFQPIPKVIAKLYEQEPDSLIILPAEYFYPYNPYDETQKVKQLMFCDITPNTYAIHHWHKSWKLNRWQKLLNSLKKRLNI